VDYLYVLRHNFHPLKITSSRLNHHRVKNNPTTAKMIMDPYTSKSKTPETVSAIISFVTREIFTMGINAVFQVNSTPGINPMSAGKPH
jgi:hypothetical protein